MKKLVYLLLLAVSWPSFAARQFDIEVILFKRLQNPDQISESWPDQLKPVDLQGALSFADVEMLQAKGAVLLPESEYQLGQQYETLQQHAGFEPLAHIAWRQGDEDRRAAPKFHLTAGKDFSANYLEDGSRREVLPAASAQLPATGIEQTDADADEIVIDTPEGEQAVADVDANLDTEAEEQSIKPLFELEGLLQVYVQHYLFVETSMDLREPSRREVIVGTEIEEEPVTPASSDITAINEASTDDLITPEPQTASVESSVQVGHLQAVKKKVKVEDFLKSYRFEQKRRMRSGETHFLDHPLLGMIIQVRKVVAEEVSSDEPQEAASDESQETTSELPST